MSEKGFTITVPVHIKRDRRARKVLAQGDPLKVEDTVPQTARLLALAHKWEGMVRRGEVKDYAEIARLMGLTRGRVTQICSLALLAPNIQEALLAPEPNPAPIQVRAFRLIVSSPNWHEQRLRPGHEATR